MMKKGPKQQFVEIRPIPFQNDDHMNAQLENTGKISVLLKPKSSLHSVVYPISEANSSSPFNFLIRFKQNKSWEMNIMNDGKMNFIM